MSDKGHLKKEQLVWECLGVPSTVAGKPSKYEPEAAALFLPTVRELGGASPLHCWCSAHSVLLSPVPLPMGWCHSFRLRPPSSVDPA